MTTSMTQAGRPMSVECTLGPDALLLESYHGVEGLSRLFTFELEMISEDREIEAADLLGTAMLLRMDLPDGEERFVHGLVNRFIQGDVQDESCRYQAEIVSWATLLTYSRQSRIFQEMTVLEIVEQVFGDLGHSDYDLRCTRPYAKREYCVQYRETDWDFVSRLLEEEGIFYFFEHEEERHLLVLADDNQAFEPAMAGGSFVFDTDGVVGETDVIRSLAQERAIHPGKVSLRDYDYLQPSLNLEATLEGEPEVSALTSLEIYDYPGDYSTLDDGDRLARLQLEAREAEYHTVLGDGDVRALCSARTFELRGHPLSGHNREYLVRTVRLFARNPGVRSRGSGSFQYRNEFRALPSDIPFRPARRTPAPVVHGPQTAVVVGKRGEEIWTDRHGRVKVQFHWDRHGQLDENSSCWLRVASPWAGKGYGSLAIPRIGQEVVVGFLEGDPDRPILVGSVYNAEQTPPLDPSAGGMSQGMISRSTPGGGGFNQISVNDSSGEEGVTIHAQYDMNTTVGNDATEEVGNDRTASVATNDTLTVGADQTLDVGGSRVASVGADESVSIGGAQAVSVAGDRSVDVGANGTIVAGSDLALEGGANVTVASGADTVVDAAANFAATAGANLDLSAGAAASVSAPQISISGDGTVEITCGGSSIKMTPGSIEISAPTITVNGSGMVDLKGGMVKVNS